MDQLDGTITIGKHFVSFSKETVRYKMEVRLGVYPWLQDKNQGQYSHRHAFYVMTPQGPMEVFFRGDFLDITPFFSREDWPTEEE